MDHVSPAHARLESELAGVVWHHAEVERVFITLLNQLFIGAFGFFGVSLSLPSLQVGIKYQERCCSKEHDHQEQKVLEKQAEKLA